MAIGVQNFEQRAVRNALMLGWLAHVCHVSITETTKYLNLNQNPSPKFQGCIPFKQPQTHQDWVFFQGPYVYLTYLAKRNELSSCNEIITNVEGFYLVANHI